MNLLKGKCFGIKLVTEFFKKIRHNFVPLVEGWGASRVFLHDGICTCVFYLICCIVTYVETEQGDTLLLIKEINSLVYIKPKSEMPIVK